MNGKRRWGSNKSRLKFLIPTHPLINFEIENYFQNEPKFIFNVYSRNNLSKIKDVTYIINLDEYESIGIHGIVLYVSAKNVTHFDSFEVEFIPKEIRKFILNKNIITSIYRVEAHTSIMYRYFCIGLIDFMLKGKKFIRVYKFVFS